MNDEMDKVIHYIHRTGTTFWGYWQA